MRKLPPEPKPELLSFRPLLDGFDTLIPAGVPLAAFSRPVLEAVTRARTTQDFATWDAFLDMLDQARAHLGDERFSAAFEQFEGGGPEIAAFSAPGVSVQTFCRAMFDAYGAGSFPGVSSAHRELPDGSVELAVWMPEGFRDTTSFWMACVGVNRQIPRWLGLPPARVTPELTPQRMRLHLAFDETATPGARSEAPARTEAFAEVLRVMRQNLERAVERIRSRPRPEERLAALSAEWKLTPRQRQVLGCICRGLSNQEIAEELDCSKKTVELHVTSLLRKAGLDSRAQLLSRFAGSD